MPVPPTQQWQTGILTCLITGHARLFILQKNSTLTQSFTEEKKGVDFSPRSGEATSGEKKIPHESRVAGHE